MLNPATKHSEFLSVSRVTWLFVFYALIISYGSVVPLDFERISFESAVVQFREIQDLNLGVYHRADWLANLFLYIPLGFLGVVLFSRLGKAIWWRVVAVLLASIISIALAFGVEFAQLWFPTRTVSQNDLRAEAIGSVAGVIIGLIAVIWAPRLWRRITELDAIATRIAVVAYVLAIVGYSLLPGDLVLSREEFLAQYEYGRVNIVPFADIAFNVKALLKGALQVVCFAPAGYFAAQAMAYRTAAPSSGRRIAFAAAAGLGFAACIEVVQLGIFSRESTMTAVVYGAVGAALGGLLQGWVAVPERRPRWLITALRASRQRRFWQVGAVVCAAAIVVVTLAPFTPIDNPEQSLHRWKGFLRPPFAALYFSSEFEVLTNVMQKGVLFFCFGCCMHLACTDVGVQIGGEGWGTAKTLAAATLLGSAVEVAQVYVSTHLPDITDIIIYVFFAFVGFQMVEVGLRLGLASERREAALDGRGHSQRFAS